MGLAPKKTEEIESEKNVLENFNLRYQVFSETLKNCLFTLKSSFLTLGPKNLAFWDKMRYLFTHFTKFSHLAFSRAAGPAKGPITLKFLSKIFFFVFFSEYAKNIKNLV